MSRRVVPELEHDENESRVTPWWNSDSRLRFDLKNEDGIVAQQATDMSDESEGEHIRMPKPERARGIRNFVESFTSATLNTDNSTHYTSWALIYGASSPV